MFLMSKFATTTIGGGAIVYLMGGIPGIPWSGTITTGGVVVALVVLMVERVYSYRAAIASARRVDALENKISLYSSQSSSADTDLRREIAAIERALSRIETNIEWIKQKGGDNHV